MGTQRQHYELQLTYFKITNDVMVKKYEYMNYNISRKVGEREFFYIFCFANMRGERGLISYVLGLQTSFLVCLKILLNLYKKENS